jgi:8-oxo-dGTP pyrophosphatase MutT (NUDIX family)
MSHRHQSGIIAYRIASDGLEILLLTSRDTRRFIIPKGNIGHGVSPREAGVKEAYEEAGVVGTVDSDFPLGFFTYSKRQPDGSEEPTTVEVYTLHVERQLKRWPEKKERKVCWVAPDQAAKLVAEPSLSKLLLRFAEIMMKP